MNKRKKRILRFLFRYFLLQQEAPEKFRRWLVVTATICIILLFSFSMYVFATDIQMGITADHEHFVSIASSLHATTAEPVIQIEQQEKEDQAEGVVPMGVMTPLPASTSAPAGNVTNGSKTK